MDSLFGRRKTKTRQLSISAQDLNEVSIPYDKLAPPKSPLPLGTTSQGLRSTQFISAPITNPTLTADGTELNKFAIQRSRAERERAYENLRSSSPNTISTADSSTLYSEPNGSSSKLYNPQSRIRKSDASSSSMPDFGHLSMNGSGNQFPTSNSTGTVRPPSSMTTRSDNRNSKYAASLSSSEAGSHLSISNLYHPHRLYGSSHDGGFEFPRPDTDEEIEALFDNVKRTRDLGDMPNLSIDQKWHMVYNDSQIRWKEDRARAEQTKRQTDYRQPAPIVRESPEWYIRKFLDRTMTAKQASSLLVSLRSKELRCVPFNLLPDQVEHVSLAGINSSLA